MLRTAKCKDRLAVSDSEVETQMIRKTSGQGHCPDRTRRKYVTTGDQRVGQSETASSTDGLKYITTGDQHARLSDATSSTEDYDKESSTRYELTTPIFGRRRPNDVKTKERITGMTRTKTRDENTCILSVISRTDLQGDKIARLADTVDQIADCLQNTLESVNVTHMPLNSATGTNAKSGNETMAIYNKNDAKLRRQIPDMPEDYSDGAANTTNSNGNIAVESDDDWDKES